MEKNVVILAILSGEVLIAEVENDNGTAYICRNVLQILTEVNDETGALQLIPYLPYSDPDAGIAIPTATTILAVPSAELVEFYSKRFSLIITPDEKKIII